VTNEPSIEPDFQQKLLYRFDQQAEFTADYSPLYTQLFRTIANWLKKADDPVVTWLLAAAKGRNSFDIPLLLAAGLHRDVLLRVPEVAGLAAYYPSVGGERSGSDPDFPISLRQAIITRSMALADFIRTATVQTNETGRGLCWLLPLLYTNWPAVHLVDLGASAGLNLAADQRAYRLLESPDSKISLDIGLGHPVQFLVSCRPQLPNYPITPLPQILSRTGCDIHPFVLQTAEDENTLAAYVWPDQRQRQQRLREGIAAFYAINQTDVTITLHSANLPDDLPDFLHTYVPSDPVPVVCYNSYITQYLRQRGALLRQHLADWAAGQLRPVLWLQWEPDRTGNDGPEYGWLRWTADLWQERTHRQFYLAWVQPHGTHVQFEPGLEQWAVNFR
jgi:hypothetical protein